MTLAVLFPGQAAQTAGWGRSWVDHPSWSVVERAEAAAGRPLAHLLLTASAGELARTESSQLSVLLASLVAWEAVRANLDEAPVAYAGHSLGQITALIASGAVSFDEGVWLAVRRAEATQAAADRHHGVMAALLGADLDQAAAACRAAEDQCWLANDNAPGQVVIAGTEAGVAQASDAARQLGVRKVLPLAVGGAFHTPLMADAAAAMTADFAAARYAEPAAPVVSNGDGVAVSSGSWGERLTRHLVEPVRWRQCLLTLQDLGVTQALEVGPGALLAGMAKRTIPNVSVRSVGAPDDVQALVPAR
ncbi:MAG: [acyl-carrier-protein] S-malonyltransferase [Actinomycetota bacterium]|jgi:[acyl-carrier-protein] S-malonyltransferase|nr:[acyl-carrier-protein] S-malonyltransferase [Actinomycetota bacterium]